MNIYPSYIIFALLATVLALGPLAFAAYLDFKQKNEAKQKSR